MMSRLAALAAATLAMACQGEIGAGKLVDGGVGAADATGPDADSRSGVAPDDVRPSSMPAADGDNVVDVATGEEALYRVEAIPGEHIGFDLRFSSGTQAVLMTVDRWDGDAPVEMLVTDGGIGIRTLAVLDQSEPRTFWVRISADDPIVGATLTVTRTPFTEGVECTSDCARLLQLPIPNDPAVDGYAIDQGVFRYQFGRRDLIMWIRHAGRVVVAEGMQPFRPEDLSQWDGETPGADRNALRHASHKRGKDVDISLYGDDGEAPWRSYCTTSNNGSGRECNPGTISGYDGYRNAIMFAAFYETGRITNCFLDRELHGATQAGAAQASTDGKIASELLPLYSDGVRLQHWPNHDNHIHVRVSEATDTSAPAPFVAP